MRDDNKENNKTVVINYKCDVNIGGSERKDDNNKRSVAIKRRRVAIDSSESSQSSQD